MRIIKFIILASILLTFNNKFVSARSIRIRRSPDFWDDVKRFFGGADPPPKKTTTTTTENPCQDYSQAGDCLGDIDEAVNEQKCMFCPKTCKEGTLLDRHSFCRRIISLHISKHPNKL